MKPLKKINGFILVGVMFLASCQFAPTYQGRQVPPEKRISLKEGGPHQGGWSGRDLVLSYTYQRTQTQASFAGTIEFTSGVSNFPMVKRFGMEIFFLNDEGMVMDARGFYNAGYGRAIDTPWRFKRQFEIPAETASVAFGYSGEAIELGRDRWDSMNWHFWDTPFRSE